MPDLSYACARKHTEPANHQVKTEKVTLKDNTHGLSACDTGHCKDDCCNNTSHHCQQGNCNGSCGGSTCSSPAGFQFFMENQKSDLSDMSFAISSKKNNFFYLNPHYSFGFHSIWQPPKIG
ncbi:hypothetical protein ACM44_12135 [Chryseobacterium koreense CCUG 49689]|uniref:Uncharacterized protein n=1 Tax=Chryseobacterium koreense CCUG 49689 TaxID=1304281 RepID=A0A0J7IX93_9FLAO|nr:hypothetical protein ACM44_12135 [Chryseobacterium koreense CCUG 49689]